MTTATLSRASAGSAVIVGLGRSGVSTARHLVRRGWKIAVTDSRAEPPGVAALRELAPQAPLRCMLKIRYLSQPVAATVTPLGEERFSAMLDEPKHGVAPGQAAVCYDGDRVLGGGWIE